MLVMRWAMCWDMCWDMLAWMSPTQARNVTWLAGRAYHMFGVSVPVRHTSSNGTRTEGPFDFVLWENMTECILAGREYSGVSKIKAIIFVD